MIDTAVLYRHPRGRSYKTALRVLTRKFLSREIQDSGNGHDSVEDARATLELALLKIRHGTYVIYLCANVHTKWCYILFSFFLRTWIMHNNVIIVNWDTYSVGRNIYFLKITYSLTSYTCHMDLWLQCYCMIFHDIHLCLCCVVSTNVHS